MSNEMAEHYKLYNNEKVPFSDLWLPGTRQFDIIFPKDTVLSSSILLALFDVVTPPDKCISVSGQNIDDHYWTKKEPLLPCFVLDRQIVIPANTKVTCMPVLSYIKENYDSKKYYKGIHLAYTGGMLGFKK